MDLTKTVELLDRNMDKVVSNEGQIVEAIGDIIQYLGTVEKRFAHLEGHIGQLTKRPAVIVKPRGKLGTVLLFGTAFYIGYKMSDRKNREAFQKLRASFVEDVRTMREKAEPVVQEYAQKVTDAYTPKQGTYSTGDASSTNHPSVDEANRHDKPAKPNNLGDREN